jgi:hypothetical protein
MLSSISNEADRHFGVCSEPLVALFNSWKRAGFSCSVIILLAIPIQVFLETKYKVVLTKERH